METTEQTMIDILFAINQLKENTQAIRNILIGSEGINPSQPSTK